MATTVSYNASMRTRKTSSSGNAKSAVACQEYYDDSYNYVGIVHFSGMALAGKVITGITLRITADQAGYGTGHAKTVYVRKSKYQAVSQSGVTGGSYYGDALGTFSGAFYNNTTTHTLTGALLTNLAAYLEAGNNTICLFNPSPVKSSQGYSTNYLQWSACKISVTYEEAASQPGMSAYTLDMGTQVTLYTNRQSSAATHTLRYSFFSVNQTIATGVTDSCAWTPPVSLAAQIPNAASGWGTLLCDTYVNGKLVSTKSCTFTLRVPASVAPTISGVSIAEATAGIAAQFGAYVRTRSTLAVSIAASGAQGSTVSSCRTTLDGAAYTGASFTSNTLNKAGSLTLTVTVADSRGRTASTTRTISVVDYSPPSLTKFTAERCNSSGTAPQMDGTRVRVSVGGSVSPVGTKNAISCTVYYKTSSASAWTQAAAITPSSYSVNTTNLLLPQTFNALSSYDLKVRLQDSFYYIEQTVSIGTKQVMMDFYKDGSGVAFGKVAETPGAVEFGWPVKLTEPLGVDQGGTDASNAASACANLGAVKKSGDTMTGNLSISGYLYPSLYLLPTYNSTTNRVVFEGSYAGAASFSAWQDSTGNNRRMLEVRSASYESSRDNAVVLRDVINGSYYAFRVFHSGMATPVPIGSGGTGASNAAAARSNLGANNASNLNAGTVAMARLPFKIAYGSTSINGSTATTINYASAGFTSVPKVLVTYNSTSSNWSGDNGAIKVYNKTTTQANIIVGGSFSSSRGIDWLAIGT
jgi:hypothetical protein